MLEVHEPGPFEAEIVLHLHDHGIRQVVLAVRGVGVATEGTTDGNDEQPAP